MKTKILLIFTILVLVQLAIRTHNIMALPIFTDENSHLTRAAHIYDFDQHPAVNSHGKFFFYFIPGVFQPEESLRGLFLARVSVALASLLTSAVIFRIGKRLLDDGAALAAVGFYAFVPFAFFFERMVMADPAAGLFAALTVWASLRLADHPGYQRAFWLGTAMALTPATKLTLSFICFVPFFVVLFKSGSWREAWQHYHKPMIFACVVVALWWSLVFIPAAIEFVGGVQYQLADNWLVESNPQKLTLIDKVDSWWEKMRLLVGVPMTLLIWAGLALFLKQRPRGAGVVVVWLLLAWFPTFFIVASDAFQSRYLMAGFPAVALLFGGGWYAINQNSQFKKIGVLVVAGVFGTWVLGFVMPFAQNLTNEPATLGLPAQDQKDYISGYYNAYGLEDAVRYLNENGERADGIVSAIANTHFCLPPLYKAWDVEYVCQKYLDQLLPEEWRSLVIEPLESGVPVYLISDYDTLDFEYQNLTGELLAVFEKPQSHIEIKVWELYLRE